MNLTSTLIFAYIGMQLIFAWWASRRVHDEVDYLLAGRKLGPWLATFTVFATWFGAETCIGATSQAYSLGLSGARMDPFGYAFAIIIVGVFFAIPLWKRGIITLADLFRQRYGNGVERFVTILMIPTSLLWAAAQIRAFGQVMAASSDLPVIVAITFAAAVVIVYTVSGGMWADAMTDLVQGCVLIFGISLVFGLVMFADGGARLVTELPPLHRQFFPADRHWLDTLETFAIPICGTIVAQELVSRVLAMRSPSLARRATVAGGLIYLVIGLMPVTLGLIAVHYVGEFEHPEQVLISIAQRELPGIFYVIFVGALISAILSTVDSALLVAGSLAAHNLVLPLKPDLPEAARVKVNRIAVVCFGLIAYGLALASDNVYQLVTESSSFGSAGIFVAMLFSLRGTRVGGPAAAYATLATGLGVYVYAEYLAGFAYPYLTSLAAALSAYLLVSLVSRPATRAKRSIA
ncbi:MAG: sodium:solute symporter family protein [Methylococcaceae bacterium]|nr:sodium:solute symporter family protein [Methylococcaceae bacterium]